MYYVLLNTYYRLNLDLNDVFGIACSSCANSHTAKTAVVSLVSNVTVKLCTCFVGFKSGKNPFQFRTYMEYPVHVRAEIESSFFTNCACAIHVFLVHEERLVQRKYRS